MPPLQAIPREAILAALEKLGPSQPVEIRKETGGETVLVGAVLSELVGIGAVVISKTKRGGSPFYYLPQKPETLERLAQFLPEKDRRTWQLLKDAQVLRSDEQTPLVRVSLQNIPDFSRQFMIGDISYWRYYLVSEEQALALITPPTPKAAVVEAQAPAVFEKPVEIAQTQPVQPEPVKISTAKPARKPRKKTTKKTEKVEQTQTTLEEDPLVTKTELFLKTKLANTTIKKAETEISWTITTQHPYGSVQVSIYSTTKKLTERLILKVLLEARGQGMPLIVLTTEELPKKIEETFEETPNIRLQRLG